MKISKNTLFVDYFKNWVQVYKKGSVREVTLLKYQNTIKHLENIAPKLKLCDLTKFTYQNILNAYAETHARQTTMDFHTHLKAAILDAVDDGLLKTNPCRRVAFKNTGTSNTYKKKEKFLSFEEYKALLNDLELGPEVSFDWLIYFIAKTGVRFSEAIAVTPNDFDFKKGIVHIDKTWDYKLNTGFSKTKTLCSIRDVVLDPETKKNMKKLCNKLPKTLPIFITKDKIYNSTANDILERHCKKLGITPISIHGLRHTHASILLYLGVTVASVSKRLGHSDMTITQKVYLHIIKELENRDNDLIRKTLSNL